MIERVISGGQTGADQAGLRAARALGIETGGTAPRGWKTESGAAPWLADYGLIECEEDGYPARTRANVQGSDGTLWFGDWHTRGGRTTLDACRLAGKPFMIVYRGTMASAVRAWIAANHVHALNIAGNRASVNPELGARVERFLVAVLKPFARPTPDPARPD